MSKGNNMGCSGTGSMNTSVPLGMEYSVPLGVAYSISPRVAHSASLGLEYLVHHRVECWILPCQGVDCSVPLRLIRAVPVVVVLLVLLDVLN